MWNELKNKHAGETCLIIGNGPSLKDVPLTFLKKYPTLGSNRIYILSDFVPTYLTCINPVVLEQFFYDFDGVKTTKFIRAGYDHLVSGSLPLHSSAFPMFSKNPSVCVYEGFTVTFVSMQLAWWMGFTTVLLVGVDHRFTFSGVPNQEMKADAVDVNHFDPNYFSGCQWNNPDLEGSEHAYKIAYNVYKQDGRKIINLTQGTALEVFERGEITEW